ncbi:MAG TPA: hypothetical protein VJ888_09655 [Mobilitalea sp.]|nr:hypothetical protein [Mobilitalea sp.]
MKIAFWSNTYEQSKVSVNLTAISIALVFRYPYSMTVMENQLNKDNLGWAYLGTNRASVLREVGTNYYDGGGMEGLLRRIYRGENSPGILNTYLSEVIHNHLYYIPQSGFITTELFDYELNHNAVPLLELLEDAADICCIDTAPLNLNTKNILEAADLIVVNLCQNQNFLEDFFQSYSSLIPKAIFIIGNYSNQTILSLKGISRQYSIPPEIITAIPWNESFETACSRGRAVEFITGNYMCTRDNPNYYFIQAIKKAASTIIKRSELTGKLIRGESRNCGR